MKSCQVQHTGDRKTFGDVGGLSMAAALFMGAFTTWRWAVIAPSATAMQYGELAFIVLMSVTTGVLMAGAETIVHRMLTLFQRLKKVWAFERAWQQESSRLRSV